MAEEEEAPQPAGEETPEPAGPGTDAGPSAQEIESWKGRKLDEVKGASVGKVEGSYVDDVSEEAVWILARMGRFGHYTLVPARFAVSANERVWVPFDRDQIRKAPRVHAGKPIDRDTEQALLDHYGVGTSATGRGAELAQRDPEAVTTRPARF